MIKDDDGNCYLACFDFNSDKSTIFTITMPDESTLEPESIPEANQKQVSKEEFIRFLQAYPGKFLADVCGISDPPLLSYTNEQGDMIAWTHLCSTDPDDFWYDPNPTYTIVEE